MAKKSELRQPTTGRSGARWKPCAFVTNLSDGRSAEDALRESEARFSLFMDHLPGVSFLKDPQGRYVYVSPGFVNLSGRAPGLCLGSSDEEFWPESAERLRTED
jgi:PAS domain-containing protein